VIGVHDAVLCQHFPSLEVAVRTDPVTPVLRQCLLMSRSGIRTSTDGQHLDLPCIGAMKHNVRDGVRISRDLVVGIAICARPFGKSVDIWCHYAW
jgi:hypothetical protein